MTIISAAVGTGAKNQKSDVQLVQTLLNRHASWLDGVKAPEISGTIDPDTISAITQFQLTAAAFLKADGVVSPHGFTIRQLNRTCIPKPRHQIFTPMCWGHQALGDITEIDYTNAATTLNCKVAAIKAIAQVETKKAAWDPLGRPTILFERHRFSYHTHRIYDPTHSDIANRHPGGYGLPNAQYGRLYRAATLDETSALQAASWGTFQIMGENYAEAGYQNVSDFVDSIMIDKKHHLTAFVFFIQADKTRLKALQTADWSTFAMHYNGPNYKENDYDTKIAAAYAALSPPAPPKPQAPSGKPK